LGGTSWRVVLWAVLGLAAAAPARAQTTDPVFAGWRFSPATVGSRSAGMGGAFVAVADDARAAVTNPAGLTQVPTNEVSFSTGRPWVAGASGRRRFRVAAYATKAEQEPAEPREGPERIALQPSITEFGVAAGLQIFQRVRLGAAVAHSRMNVEEEGRNASNGAQPVHPLVGGEDAQVRYTFGVLIDLLRVTGRSTSPLRFAFAVQPGMDWTVPQTGGGTVDIRRPTVTSFGLGWRADNHWSFSTQADFIRFRDVVETLRRNVGNEAAAGFELPDEVEPRIGGEYATPLTCGCGSVKVRAGLHYQSPGTLRYAGDDPDLAAAFTSQRRLVVFTLGGSLFAEHFGNALRFDLDARDVLDGPALSFGVVWRF
jgi:long-chain fatty acid transport protein